MSQTQNQDVSWSAPSNIAFVKYWGKQENQIPMNASVSGTLSKCYTKTSVQTKMGEFDIDFSFEGKKNEPFKEKILPKFEKYYLKEIPVLQKLSLSIDSINSFPHSCGIASSASFYASLALCLCEIEGKFKVKSADFLKRASELARMGSGSASRSLFGPMAEWGTTDLTHAAPLNYVHNNFQNMSDYICIISSEEKSISSTVGHGLMNGHPYREVRKQEAIENQKLCLESIKTGDWKTFINVVESEANQLHALMMTSKPSFILLKPNTLKLLEEFREFRDYENLEACYTIDAGPNVHILTSTRDSEKIGSFLNTRKHLFEDGKIIKDILNGEVVKIG